jgi:hypothetical protein
VVGYKPAVVARLDPRTLRALPGPRIELPYGVSGYAWSPDRSRLVLGDLDDDALHVVDPAAANASWQAGRLLAYGRRWDGEAEHERGVGVTVHGPGADGSTCSAPGPSTRPT